MDQTTSTAMTLLGTATAGLLLMVGFAFADKPVAFTGDRDTVQETCSLNQGAYIDQQPESNGYGCFTQAGWIWCRADGHCEAGRHAMQVHPGAGGSRSAWPIPGAGPQGTNGQLTAWPWMKAPAPDETVEDPLARLLGPHHPSGQPGS